ncbi:MAG: ABC transporter permease subunit [Chloroflexi bacterium]|nr:ABC transporter permease subunit [Chloroflexota bacterium]OJV98342.1 MAG: hypothetical protein BGO39_16335 [Chloroflexi bacterium 54-19]
MLYKEFRAAGPKYLTITFGYVLVGLLVSTLFGPYRNFPSSTIFHTWVQWILFITIGAAILGGADTIAEENGKSTLSFLLTRPISRTRVYAVKFLVSAACLTAILVTTSLVMFLVEQLPQRFKTTQVMLNGDVVESSFDLEKMPAGEAFTCIVVILGIGLAVLALTTLISIFSRSTTNTIVTTLLVGFGLIAIYAFTDLLFSISYRINRIFDIYHGLGLGDFFVLLALAVGLYWYGLKIFKAKEF